MISVLERPGTALLDEGINIKIAQSRLGHANPRTTLAVYAQATAEADREAASKLGDRFPPTIETRRG
jgi:integrase